MTEHYVKIALQSDVVEALKKITLSVEDFENIYLNFIGLVLNDAAILFGLFDIDTEKEVTAFKNLSKIGISIGDIFVEVSTEGVQYLKDNEATITENVRELMLKAGM